MRGPGLFHKYDIDTQFLRHAFRYWGEQFDRNLNKVIVSEPFYRDNQSEKVTVCWYCSDNKLDQPPGRQNQIAYSYEKIWLELLTGTPWISDTKPADCGSAKFPGALHFLAFWSRTACTIKHLNLCYLLCRAKKYVTLPDVQSSQSHFLFPKSQSEVSELVRMTFSRIPSRCRPCPYWTKSSSLISALSKVFFTESY